MAFNKKEYDINYMKLHKKQFKVALNRGDYLKYTSILKVKKISNIDFVINSFKKIEEKLNMKEKIEVIENMLKKIRDNAIEEYTKNIDENNSISIDDWQNGYRGTIRDYDGKIIEYIPYADFMDLYSNFANELYCSNEKLNDIILDNIIKFLKEEAKYTNYHDLDSECYCIEDFE